MTINKFWFINSIIGDIRNYYTLDKEIGRGTYGIVFTAIKNSNGKKVAIKFVQKSVVTKDEESS